MNVIEQVISVLSQVLRLEEKARHFDADTALFGAIAEFDSMAVVIVVTTLEERFGIVFEDEEITAEVFETVGSLTRFIEGKLVA